MHPYQTSVHLPVAVPHAFVLIRPTIGVGTSAHAICGLISHRAASGTASAGELRSTPMPMRVIAKKRCRAMFEPPEKGERATLNPNLSTRLKPTFFSDQALGRRVGYAGRSLRFMITRPSHLADNNYLGSKAIVTNNSDDFFSS